MEKRQLGIWAREFTSAFSTGKSNYFWATCSLTRRCSLPQNYFRWGHLLPQFISVFHAAEAHECAHCVKGAQEVAVGRVTVDETSHLSSAAPFLDTFHVVPVNYCLYARYEDRSVQRIAHLFSRSKVCSKYQYYQ